MEPENSGIAFATLFTILLVISAGAGFLYFSEDQPTYSPPPVLLEWMDPVVEGNESHDHNDLLQHWLWTENMTLIDYHNMNCDGQITTEEFGGRKCSPEYKNTAPTTGENGEIVISGDFPDCVTGCYAYVAAYHNFHILDISDPSNIQMISTYYAEDARIIDIKVTADNNWALINHELTNVDDDGNPLDPAPSDIQNGANEIHLIDISNKEEPRLVSRWQNPPAGYHNQEIYLYPDGSVFLFLADPISEGTGKGTQIAKVFEQNFLGDEDWIQLWANYEPEADTTCGGSVFNHDNVVRVHPVTGQVLMYIAYWDAGLRILDVSSPPSTPSSSWPNEIGRWLGCPTDDSGWYGPEGGGHANMDASEWTGSSEGNGNIHYVVPFDELIDGRHYTVIAPEFGSNDAHTGWVRLIDTTDPTKPFLVAQWRLPGNHTIPGNYIYSPHNGDTGATRIYWSHYHGGAWVTEADTVWESIQWKMGARDPEDSDFNGFQEIEKLGQIETLAYYLPHGPDWIENASQELDYENSDGWTGLKIPFDWGLNYDPRGYIYISDIKTGVYVVQYDGDRQPGYIFEPSHPA